MSRKIYLVLEENESFIDVREIEPRNKGEAVFDFKVLARLIEGSGYSVTPSDRDNGHDA